MKTKFTRFKSFEVLEEDSNDEERSENFKCQILPKPPNINGDKKRKRSDYEGNNCEITPSTSSSLEIGGTKNIKILSNVVLNHQEDSTSQVKYDQLEDQSVKSASQVPSQAPYNARAFSGNNLESGNIIEYLKKIIRKQNLIQSTLLEMAEEIIELKKHVRSNAIRLEPEERESIFTSLNLPVNTQEDLDALEEFLNDETRLKNAVKDVCTSGGKDVYELIYRATGKLITNGFASGYSFYGKKQKMKFSALKLNKLLIDSAVKTFICTEKEAEVSIAKWLKRCTERAKNERR